MRFLTMVRFEPPDARWAELWECYPPPGENPLPYLAFKRGGTLWPAEGNTKPYRHIEDVPWPLKFHRRNATPQESLLTVEARERFDRTYGHRAVPSGGTDPFGFVDHLAYEVWGLSPWGTWWLHTAIPVEEIHCVERDKGIRHSASVRRYTRWLKEGRRAPPIIVMRHREGYLISYNRRRVVSAQEAGTTLIPAWFNEWSHDIDGLMWAE